MAMAAATGPQQLSDLSEPGRSGGSRGGPVLTLGTMNPAIRRLEYAVRGPIVTRALQLEQDLRQVTLPPPAPRLNLTPSQGTPRPGPLPSSGHTHCRAPPGWQNPVPSWDTHPLGSNRARTPHPKESGHRSTSGTPKLASPAKGTPTPWAPPEARKPSARHPQTGKTPEPNWDTHSRGSHSPGASPRPLQMNGESWNPPQGTPKIGTSPHDALRPRIPLPLNWDPHC